MTLGVGIIGCGGVTQAIHLPTLARLSGELHVAHVMDLDANVAESVAARVDARWSTSVEELLADDGVDIVAICSPSHLHADHVVAACAANVKAILCEKPFAENREQAERIAAASRQSGVPIIVGTMHAFDPSWLQLRERWGDLPEQATLVRSRIILPGNARFEDFATQVRRTPPKPSSTMRKIPATESLHGLVLGLAIHDLPLVRTFLGGLRAVESAEYDFANTAYIITVLGETGCRGQLYCAWTSGWKPDWTLDVWSPDAAIHIDFPPSYVQAGSGTGRIASSQGVTMVPWDSGNGYEGEWRALAAIAQGDLSLAPALDALIDDLVFAIGVADGAAALLSEVAS